MAGANGLTLAQTERLAWLVEELGEAQQAVGKVLRHGYASNNNGKLPHTNKERLEQELADVIAATELLTLAHEIDHERVRQLAAEKINAVARWMHHQS